MRAIIFACVLLSFVVTLLTGCASETQIAEREVRKAAVRYIGPADRYDAKVSGLTATHAQRVLLNGYNVHPDPNLTLQRLTLTLDDVSYRRNPFLITGIGSTQFSIQATDAEVTTYVDSLLAQNPNRLPVRSPLVTFQTDLVRVAGTVTLGGQESAVTTTGTLQPKGAQVQYQPQTVSADNPAVSDQLRALITGVQIPLFDLSRLAFAPQIQTITLRPGIITISGTGDATRLLDGQRE